MRKKRERQKAATFLERKQKVEGKKTRTEEEAAISKAAIFETVTARKKIRDVETEKKVDGVLRQIIGSSEALEKDQKERTRTEAQLQLEMEKNSRIEAQLQVEIYKNERSHKEYKETRDKYIILKRFI